MTKVVRNKFSIQGRKLALNESLSPTTSVTLYIRMRDRPGSLGENANCASNIQNVDACNDGGREREREREYPLHIMSLNKPTGQSAISPRGSRSVFTSRSPYLAPAAAPGCSFTWGVLIENYVHIERTLIHSKTSQCPLNLLPRSISYL